MIVDLPSGLKLELRKMRGQELINIAERASRKGPQTLSQMVAPCWVQTIDRGPYASATPGQPLPWSRLLRGDIIAALLALRVSSVPDGARYEFAVQCEKCSHRYDWRIDDLMADLPVRRLSDEDKSILLDDGLFEARTLSGVRVAFKLMTEEDDEPLRKLMKLMDRKSVTFVETLAVQARTIEGIDDPAPSLHKRQRFFAELDYDELLDLRNQFDAHDCGVDTDIETTCPECNWKQDVDFPFGRTFFIPDLKKRTSTPSSSLPSSRG